jgi:iron complex transport system substrate-binding protein
MLLASLLLLLSVWSGAATAMERIVSVDGALTEIVYALGAEARLVGVDTTSQYPLNTVKDLPNVGYKRNLSAEGILALQPDLLLLNDDAGPPEVLQQVQAVGVEIAFIPNQPTVAGLHAKVRAVARVLGRVPQGEQLVKRINTDLADARQIVQAVHDKPRILFLLHIGSGADMSGGGDTVADAMITLAGGVNVMGHAFTGYKPITPEAVVAAAPEIVLITRRNLVSLGGKQKVIDRIGLANTPAGREDRVVAMDGLFLLGFGPRTGQAVAQLANQLHKLTQ